MPPALTSHSQMFSDKMSILHGFVTTSLNVCLRSVFVHFTDNICLSKTQTNTLSLFSYRRVTFTQIFIKGPFLFYGVLSSDIIIIGLVESLNTWVQKKAATKEGSHYKNASLWCQNIGENDLTPPYKTFKLHSCTPVLLQNFFQWSLFLSISCQQIIRMLWSNECISHFSW